MSRIVLLTIIQISLCFVTYGQFKPNSIGVCYLENDSADSYNLTISLPIQSVIKQRLDWRSQFNMTIDTLPYQGQMVIFDDKGEICSIDGMEKFLIEVWCDNDGGTQYRPTLRKQIKKSSCKRQLLGIDEIRNICCFVLVNKNQDLIDAPDFKISSDIKLKGNIEGDKRTDCFIWTYVDEAENCGGEPKNNLAIMLQVGKESFGLNCCGP